MPFPYFHLDETEVLRYNYIRIHAEKNAHAKCIRSFPVMIGEKDPDAATQRFCALTASYADAVIAGHVSFAHDASLDNSGCMQYIMALSAVGNLRVFRFV